MAVWHDSLSAAELVRLGSLRLARDRRDYLAAHVLERVARPSGIGRSSLSHCDGFVACAFSGDDEVAIGVDAEPLAAEARLLEMVDVVRTPADGRDLGLIELWTVKEAFLKSTGEGFSVDGGYAVLGALECTPLGTVDEWATIQVRDARSGVRALAWTRRVGGHVVSLVTGDLEASAPLLESVALT